MKAMPFPFRLYLLTSVTSVTFMACGGTREPDKSIDPNLPVVTALDSNDHLILSVQQAWAEIAQQADLSEAATTGSDDASGTLATPRAPSPNFNFLAPGATSLPSVTAPFVASLQFTALPAADGVVDGNATVQVVPKTSSSTSAGTAQTLELTPEFSLSQTLSNGDVVRSANQAGYTVTKLGARLDGQVVRTLTGSVRRNLVSAGSSGGNIDYILTFNGVRVTDVYTEGAMTRRILSGQVKVLEAKYATSSDEAAIFVTFSDTERSDVMRCLCPSQGYAVLNYTGAADGGVEVSYTFSGKCGEALVKTTVTDHISPSVQADVHWASCTPEPNKP